MAKTTSALRVAPISATRANRKLIAVVFGESSVPDRTLRAANLLEHGFRTYAWKSQFALQTLDTLPMDTGAQLAVTKAVKVPVCGIGVHAVARSKRVQAVAAEGGSNPRPAKSKGRNAAIAKKSSNSWPW